MQDMTLGSESRFTNIHTLANRFEADLLLGVLKQEGIPVFLRTFEETAYDGLFVCQRGWGWLMVPEGYAERATAIIQPLIEDFHTRSIYVDPAEVDPLLWERLAQADAGMICSRALVTHEPKLGAFVVPFLNQEFLCAPERQSITSLSAQGFTAPDFSLCLVLLHYLLEAKPRALSGKWIGEKELPGGELFFRGLHALPLEGLTALLGQSPDLFRRIAGKLGGAPVQMGDLAFRFQAFPRIPLVLMLWEGDDEFGPEMLMRFDSTIAVHLERLDVVWALANVFTRSVEACAKAFGEGEEV